MRSARVTTFALVLGLALLAAAPGCLKRQPPDKKAFVLDLQPAPPSIDRDLRLFVARIRVSPVYAGRGFVYRGPDGMHESDFHNEFFAPPETLITEEVRQRLELANSGDAQVIVHERTEAGYVLQARVMELLGDYSGETRQSVLAVDVVVTRGPTAGGSVALQRTYRETEEVDGTPEQLVQGWNRSLERIVQSLATDLATLEEPPAPADESTS